MHTERKPTDAFREEHVELLEHIEHLHQAAAEIPQLSPEERSTVVARMLDFLQGALAPHAEAEERVLYPEVARLLGDPQATAPMIHDHAAIRERIQALDEADPADTGRLQELLYGLYALISTHFRKEEEIYLPYLDRQPAEDVARIIERMGGHGHGADPH